MNLGKIGEQIKGGTERAVQLGGAATEAATEKVNEAIDGYKRIVDVLATFGFIVDNLGLEVGLLPSIRTTITGSINAVREDGVRKMIADHADDSFLIKVLNTLLTVKRLAEQVRLNKNTVSIKLSLGVSPSMQFAIE